MYAHYKFSLFLLHPFKDFYNFWLLRWVWWWYLLVCRHMHDHVDVIGLTLATHTVHTQVFFHNNSYSNILWFLISLLLLLVMLLLQQPWIISNWYRTFENQQVQEQWQKMPWVSCWPVLSWSAGQRSAGSAQTLVKEIQQTHVKC